MTELRHDQKELSLEECDPRTFGEKAWDSLDEVIAWLKSHEEIEQDFEESHWEELKTKRAAWIERAKGMAAVISVYFEQHYPSETEVLREANRRWRAHNTEDTAHRTFGVREVPYGLKNKDKTPAGKREMSAKAKRASEKDQLTDPEKDMIRDMHEMMGAAELAGVIGKPEAVIATFIQSLPA